MLQNPVGSSLPTNVYLPVSLKVYVRDPPDLELKMGLERRGCHLWMVRWCSSNPIFTRCEILGLPHTGPCHEYDEVREKATKRTEQAL
jgi:hypothetical protein